MGGNAHRSGPFVAFPGVLSSLEARGYVVASMEYRLSGEAQFPTQAQDVKAAIRWLRLNAAKYGIDRARAVTWGGSAGGHLSGLAAVSCHATALEPAKTVQPGAPDTRPDQVASADVSDCVRGASRGTACSTWPPSRIRRGRPRSCRATCPGAPEWRLLGCFGGECRPGQLAAASPITYVDHDDPPMLLIVGSEDTTVPCQQTMEMAEKLKAEGVKHQLIVLPGINHSVIGKTPEQTREASLKALAATFKFVDETIGGASGGKR